MGEWNSEELRARIALAAGSGKRIIEHALITQSVTVKDDWIDTVENCLFSLEQIVKKPKSFIKEERELVNVEKARRVDGAAVRHLATHTEFVKEVNPDGTVRPSKVLTRSLEEELAVYENRVIYALIRRLKIFIEDRYVVLSGYARAKDTTKVAMSDEFKFGKTDVSYRMELEIKYPSKNRVAVEANKKSLERLDNIRKRLAITDGSDFCRVLAKAKPVTPPIMKTNVFASNVDYRNCYNLWLFISGFNAVGYCVDVNEKLLPVESDFAEDLTMLIAESVDCLMKDEYLRGVLYKNLKYTAKKRKNYRVLRKVDYSIDRLSGAIADTEGDLNQFYYERIKKSVNAVAGLSTAADGADTKEINMNFRRFFKGLQRINNELYYDILGISKKKSDFAGLSVSERMRLETKRQEETVAKQKLLYRLRQDELKLNASRIESAEKKLAELKRDLFIREKLEKKAKELKAKQKEELRRKKNRILKRAKEELKRLQDPKYAKRMQNLEKARLAREQAKSEATDGGEEE